MTARPDLLGDRAALLRGPLGYLLRRARRIAAFAGLGALILGLAGAVEFGAAFHQAAAAIAERAATGPLSALPAALAAHLGPPVAAVATLAILGAVALGLAGALLLTLLPVRAMPLVDGLVLGALFMAGLHASGLGGQLSALGSWVPVCAFVLAFAALSQMLWRHLPFGLPLHDRATVRVPLAPPDLAARLLAWHGADPLAPGRTARASSPVGDALTVARPSADTITVAEELRALGGVTARFRFELRPAQGGDGAKLTMTAAIPGLSPLLWWGLWTRPFAADYLVHILSEIAGVRDRSENGTELATLLRREARRAGTGQEA